MCVEIRDLRYRTFWPRFWAIWLDALVLWPINWLTIAIFTAPLPRPVKATWVAIDIFVYVLYNVVMHAWRGQTIGKMVFRIKVLDVAEQPIGWWQAMLRSSIDIIFDVLYVTFAVVNLEVYIRETVAQENSTAWPLWMTIFSHLLVVLLLVEIITMLTNSRRRSLHDWIAGTVVVRTG